jgi:PhnB protein
MSGNAVPEGYHTVTPYLIVTGADRVIDFAKSAFGAEERVRLDGPDGSVGHAELQIGDSVVMLAEASDMWKPRPTTLHLYVEDSDGVYARAVAAGGESVQEPADQFYGDRSGGVRDGADNIWWISTRVEEVTVEEVKRRSAEMAKAGS